MYQSSTEASTGLGGSASVHACRKRAQATQVQECRQRKEATLCRQVGSISRVDGSCLQDGTVPAPLHILQCDHDTK